MKFVCPYCQTEHGVPDGAIPPAGRIGKCGFCGGRVRVTRDGAVKEAEESSPTDGTAPLDVMAAEAPASPAIANAAAVPEAAVPAAAAPEAPPSPAAAEAPEWETQIARPAETPATGTHPALDPMSDTAPAAPARDLGEDTLPAAPREEDAGHETTFAPPSDEGEDDASVPLAPADESADGTPAWEQVLEGDGEEDDYGPVIGLAPADDEEEAGDQETQFRVDLPECIDEMYDLDGLRELVRAGKLHRDHFIARRHSSTWFFAEELEGLFP